MLIALNLDENQVDDANNLLDELVKKKLEKNTKALTFFGKIELEMSDLADEEAEVFMEEYGIKESALNSLIRESYNLLGLHSFFTVGEDECRAWTIKKGMNAQEAAGEIHTDFFKKFIRAEVVHSLKSLSVRKLFIMMILLPMAHLQKQKKAGTGDLRVKNILFRMEILFLLGTVK